MSNCNSVKIEPKIDLPILSLGSWDKSLPSFPPTKFRAEIEKYPISKSRIERILNTLSLRNTYKITESIIGASKEKRQEGIFYYVGVAFAYSKVIRRAFADPFVSPGKGGNVQQHSVHMFEIIRDSLETNQRKFNLKINPKRHKFFRRNFISTAVLLHDSLVESLGELSVYSSIRLNDNVKGVAEFLVAKVAILSLYTTKTFQKKFSSKSQEAVSYFGFFLNLARKSPEVFGKEYMFFPEEILKDDISSATQNLRNKYLDVDKITKELMFFLKDKNEKFEDIVYNRESKSFDKDLSEVFKTLCHLEGKESILREKFKCDDKEIAIGEFLKSLVKAFDHAEGGIHKYSQTEALGCLGSKYESANERLGDQLWIAGRDIKGIKESLNLIVAKYPEEAESARLYAFSAIEFVILSMMYGCAKFPYSPTDQANANTLKYDPLRVMNYYADLLIKMNKDFPNFKIPNERNLLFERIKAGQEINLPNSNFDIKKCREVSDSTGRRFEWFEMLLNEQVNLSNKYQQGDLSVEFKGITMPFSY